MADLRDRGEHDQELQSRLPVAIAKLRGIENTPAPTMPPTTIAVRVPSGIFCVAEELMFVSNSKLLVLLALQASMLCVETFRSGSPCCRSASGEARHQVCRCRNKPRDDGGRRLVAPCDSFGSEKMAAATATAVSCIRDIFQLTKAMLTHRRVKRGLVWKERLC